MNSICELKISALDNFSVEFEVMSDDPQKSKLELEEKIFEIDELLCDLKNRSDDLTQREAALTSHADKADHIIAVSCGVLAGVLDSVFVGEWNYKDAHIKSDIDVNKMVIQFAKNHPDYMKFCNLGPKGGLRRKPLDPDRLQTAIAFLESKFHLPGDGAYAGITGHGISGRSHRIDDWCHHPTLLGMISCILAQFTGRAHFMESSGKHWFPTVPVNEYAPFVGNSTANKVLSGIINWFFQAAQTIANRKGHLMSDIATSAGLPSGIVSLLIELASLPVFQDKHFFQELRKSYTGGIGTGKSQVDLGVFNVLFEGASSKMDVRAEMAIKSELKRQGMPVIINEMLVRGAYFIRRFIAEMREKRHVGDLDWKRLLPLENRTITRMLTVASSAFVVVDLSDAAIRSALKNGGVKASEFLPGMILRVNFVGIGRFAVAVSSDCCLGFKRQRVIEEQLKLNTVQIQLYAARMYYRQAEVWISAAETENALRQVEKAAEKAMCELMRTQKIVEKSMESIKQEISKHRASDAEFINELLEELE